MGTKILFNGSRFAGGTPADLEDLFTALATHPLNEFWKRNGIESRPYVDASGEMHPTQFQGNFEDVSHGFGVETDDTAVIERFRAAFKDNRSNVRLPHPCMADGAEGKGAPRCPCWDAHFDRTVQS